MSMPKTRIYFGGADFTNPSVSGDITDMRTTTPVNVEIPVDENGDGPNMCTIRFDIGGGVSSSFGTASGYVMFSSQPGAGYRHQRVDGDMTVPGVYTAKSWGEKSSFFCVPILPGQRYLYVQNPAASDPGTAVPGTYKIWFFKEL